MRVLVFQHVAIEHPGVFRELWEEAGDVWVPVELDAGEQIPAIDRFDLLVVMGGPMMSGKKTSTLGFALRKKRSGVGSSSSDARSWAYA